MLPEVAQVMGYQVPTSPAAVRLDVVTVTRDRPVDLMKQAELLAPQLGPNDRWLIANDAGTMPERMPWDIGALIGEENLFFVGLNYKRTSPMGTVNRARHSICSLARPGAWIVELDDHDFIEPEALARVRDAICSGAMFVYGDTVPVDESGKRDPYKKETYRPWLLRDSHCPCEGVRAFPQFLYAVSGGYRFYGDFAPNQNEFPAGDYGLFLRLELLTRATGFVRVPHVLCLTPKVTGGISTRYGAQQANMAHALRNAAKAGTLI